MLQDYPAEGLDESEISYINDASAFITSAKALNMPAMICSTFPENMKKTIRDDFLEKKISPMLGIEDAIESIKLASKYKFKQKQSRQISVEPLSTVPKKMSVKFLSEFDSKSALTAIGIEVPIAAVALGAKVIEKHLTLDTKMDGPDHKASIEPKAFFEMVRSIKNIEKALGSTIKKPTLSEINNRDVIRKSIVASKEISVGEKFNSENITLKRPGFGLSPMVIDQIIGKVSTRQYKKDDFISL